MEHFFYYFCKKSRNIMQEKTITSTIHTCQTEELDEVERRLIQEAISATERSYAPYSHFHVGAALLLANGEMVTGCNQENAAFPVTLCAERTALFAAANQYSDQAVVALAIAARNEQGLLAHPISPCGSCRQAMVETELRFRHPIRLLLYGTDAIYIVEGIRQLLPLTFDNLE